MADTDDVNLLQTSGRRQIGAIGTTARVVLGLVLLAGGVLGGRLTIVNGQVRSGFSPLSVALGLVALPAVLLAWQWLRGRRAPARFQATVPAHRAQHADLLRTCPDPVVCATPLVHQWRRARLLRGVHVARSDARLRRMRGAGRLKLAAPPRRPDRLHGAVSHRPPGARSGSGFEHALTSTAMA